MTTFVTWDGRPHDCGPYCEHPGQNGVHLRTDGCGRSAAAETSCAECRGKR